MDRAEVTQRFCNLSAEVAAREFSWERASDCFCDPTREPIGSFQYDAEVIRFIEEAVEEKFAKLGKSPVAD